MTAALEEGVSGQQHAPGKTRYPFYRRLGGPQGRSGRAENIVPTGIKSRTVQPIVSRYTDWATRPTVYIYIYIYIYIYKTITVDARSKASVCDLLHVGIAGSNPTRGHGCLSLAIFVCCQTEVSASGLSPVQRSPSNCDASKCDREISIIRKLWSTRWLSFHKKEHK